MIDIINLNNYIVLRQCISVAAAVVDAVARGVAVVSLFRKNIIIRCYYYSCAMLWPTPVFSAHKSFYKTLLTLI